MVDLITMNALGTVMTIEEHEIELIRQKKYLKILEGKIPEADMEFYKKHSEDIKKRTEEYKG